MYFLLSVLKWGECAYIGLMYKKLKNTASAHVAIKFIKHTASENMLAFTHKLPIMKNLLRNSMQLTRAYNMSKSLCVRLVRIADTATMQAPMNTERNMNRKEKERI